MARAIRLDDAGRVLVAGVSPYDAPVIARLDADGRLDSTFGVAGAADIPVSGTPGGLEIDATGRIAVTGAFGDAGKYPWLPGYAGRWYGAARLLPDGSLDPAFSGDGLLEFDAASSLSGLGAVHAAGTDGAMLAVAEKRGAAHDTPWGVEYDKVFGLARIAADGTMDAAYGDGGFASLAQGADYLVNFVESVKDFDVDSEGRAVVAVGDHHGTDFTVLRLNAEGQLDPTFWTTWHLTNYLLGSNFTASRVALDGAGRIVGLGGQSLFRRLHEGGPDRTFSGDAYALNQAAHIVGLSSEQMAALCYFQYSDPDFADDPPCGGELLAVASRADRWTTARVANYRNAKGRWVRGIEVRTIDPAQPGAIVWARYCPPGARVIGLADLAIAPDGTAAYALGNTFVLRVDLVSRKPLPLPDLRVKWIGNVHARDLGGGRYRVSALVRIRNVSRREAQSVIGLVGVGDAASDVALAPFPDAPNSLPFRIRARSSVVRRFTWKGGDIKTNLAGARLGIQVSCELPDANFSDNNATSPPITPVYAPR